MGALIKGAPMELGIQAPRSTVQIMGVDTAYYRLTPAGGTSTKPSIVLLHGGAPGACSDLNWFRNAQVLAEAGYEVIAYDQPGFGYSSAPSDHGIEFRYRHALAFLMAMRLGDVHLVGNSIGGLLCCLMALREEEGLTIRSLTLAAPYPFFETPPAAVEKLAQHRHRLSSIEPSFESIRKLCLNTFGDAAQLSDEIVALRLSMLEGANWASYQARLPVSRHFDQQRVGTGVITLPTLMIWGLADKSLPPEIGLAGMHRYPNANFLFLSGCGHWPQTEQAALFNQQVLSFLEAQSN